MRRSTFLPLFAIILSSNAHAATTLNGVVVHQNSKAKSFVVSSAAGKLSSVHTKRTLPAVGKRVQVSAKLLANKTYGLKQVKVKSEADSAILSGTVTFKNKKGFTVSSLGTSIFVKSKKKRTHGASTVEVGDKVAVKVKMLDDDSLQERETKIKGEDSHIELEGVVTAVDADARTLTLSADDEHEATAGVVTIHVPEGIDIAAYTVGAVLELRVSLNEDGTFTLLSSDSDRDEDDADDCDDHQGSDDDEGDDHGGHGDDD